MSKDPVCRRSTEEKESLSLKVEDKKYYFCSPHCLRSFKYNHRRYKRRHEVAEEECEQE